MELRDFVAQLEGFNGLPPREKIRLFAWYLHTYRGQDAFDNAAIRACYDELHMPDPNVAKYLPRMEAFKPPDLVSVKGGYKLERTVRISLDEKYGVHHTVVQVSKLLTDVIGKVPDLAEQTFLAEAIKCYRVEAYRACIIMVWNVAYNHLLNWILSDPIRLALFNSVIGKRNSRKAGLVVVNYDDFEDLKEREVIDICNSANLVNGSVYKILKEKLDRRNTAAHPSNVVVVQSQADDTITDLVNNVVLGLK
jgi:hypothetical protein